MLTLNFEPFPILSTERLILRKLTMNDSDEIFKLRSDERVSKYIARDIYKSMEDVHAFLTKLTNWLSNNESIIWGICFKDQ